MAVCLWRRCQGQILAISPVRASFFSAAFLFLRGRTRISSTSPSLSAARHRYMRLPFIRTNTYQDASASLNTNDDQPGASGSPLRSAGETAGSDQSAHMPADALRTLPCSTAVISSPSRRPPEHPNAVRAPHEVGGIRSTKENGMDSQPVSATTGIGNTSPRGR